MSCSDIYDYLEKADGSMFSPGLFCYNLGCTRKAL